MAPLVVVTRPLPAPGVAALEDAGLAVRVNPIDRPWSRAELLAAGGKLFARVVHFIEEKILPIVLRHAISGNAHINSEDPLLEDPLALAMLIDVFSERGYHAGVDIHRIEIPDRVDLATGKLTCRTKKVFRIEIRFQGSEIRRG